MKKIFTVIIISVFFAGETYANKVSSSTAQAVGVTFYKQNSKKNISIVSLVYTKTSTEGNPLYYVFNINSNDGFIIVSADDVYYPIIGYNDKGHYDVSNSSPEFNGWMNVYAKEITYAEKNNLQPKADISEEWNAYLNGKMYTGKRHLPGAVLPLTNEIWNQAPYFNALCPGGSVTGCCATAMSQILKYWGYPAHGLLSNTYNDNTPQYAEDYGVLSRNFYGDYFDWAAMPDTVNAPNAEVAQLLFDVGVSIDMNYSPSGSNAQVICPNHFSNQGADSVCNQTSYVKFFGYNRHTIQGYYKNQFSDSVWQAMLENELNHGRLIQYTGGGDIGHTWVCEGYNSSSQFYMNWGWGGSSNGYFALNGLLSNYDSLQQACIGIEPPVAYAQFYANNVSIHTGSGVYFTNESLTPTTITSWHWSFPGGTPSTSTSQNPLVTYDSAGIYDVTLIVDATGGGDTMTKKDYIVVQPNNVSLPFTQTFESTTFPPKGWYINNPNDWNISDQSYGNLWQLYSKPGGGGYGLSNSCMLFYNFNSGYRDYLVNEPPPPNPMGGQNLKIYTSTYNFTYVVSDSLSFDVAYSPYNTTYSDTLAVYYSLDCGATWNNIYYKGGMNLATTATNISTTGDTLGFIPDSSQWRTDVINLPPAVYGQPSVMFSFENRSYWGGQLYIDNVKVSKGIVEAVNSIYSLAGNVAVYPNPNSGNFTIQLSGVSNQSLVEIYNMLGEKVFAEMLPSSQNNNLIDLTGQPNGVYFYRVLQVDGSLVGSGKLIIQK